jgi:hypothetical protein
MQFSRERESAEGQSVEIRPQFRALVRALHEQYRHLPEGGGIDIPSELTADESLAVIDPNLSIDSPSLHPLSSAFHAIHLSALHLSHPHIPFPKSAG